MDAISASQYGPPLALRLVQRPAPAPGPGEVRVRVQASSINPADLFSVLGRPLIGRLAFGVFRPKNPVPGRDVAGVIESIGPNVTNFSVGERICAEADSGAYAEHALVSADRAARIPEEVLFEQAAALVLAGTTAWQALRHVVEVGPHDHVLINGASGGVGSTAVQIARHFGARVTAVCRETHRPWIEELGAEVIDYEKASFADKPGRYSVLLDLIGNEPLSACRACLAPNGTYIASMSRLRSLLWAALTGIVAKDVSILSAQPSAADLERLLRLVALGELQPVIGRVIKLGEVPDALAKQAAGHARGKTVVAV